MKLHLLHGPAKAVSRKKLIEIKQKFDSNNVVVFDPSTSSGQVSLGSIHAMFMTPSLLSDEQLFILENPPEDFTVSISDSRDLTLVLWFDHQLSDKNPILAWIKKNNGQILYFPESKEISVFPFLDYLGNRDKKAFLEMDNLKKAGYDSQYLITMIFYLLRNLISTPKTAKDFIKQKNARMRTNFSQEELVNLYEFVLETDFKIKSGLLDEKQAEFSLVNLFTH